MTILEKNLRAKLTPGNKIVTETVKDEETGRRCWGTMRHIKLLYTLLFISYRETINQANKFIQSILFQSFILLFLVYITHLTLMQSYLDIHSLLLLLLLEMMIVLKDREERREEAEEEVLSLFILI